MGKSLDSKENINGTLGKLQVEALYPQFRITINESLN